MVVDEDVVVDAFSTNTHFFLRRRLLLRRRARADAADADDADLQMLGATERFPRCVVVVVVVVI